MEDLDPNDYNLVLIEDLGLQYATEKSKSRRRVAMFRCPCCQEPFKVQVYSIRSGNTTKCNACARKEGAASRKLFDKEYPTLYNKFLRERLDQRLEPDFIDYNTFKEYVNMRGFRKG